MTLNFKNQVANFLLELFFPSFCFGCRAEGTYLCQDCRSILGISEYNYCLCDRNPFRLPPEIKGGKCQRCQHKSLSGLYFALPYKERFITKKLIYQFKYSYIKSLSPILAGIITEHLFLAGNNSEKIWQNSIFIPVPLEKRKLKDRGYNQAEELAKELSEILQVPLISNNLTKIKETKSQADLSAKERKINLRNAFLVKNAEKIRNKKIFLVDDVYTTGFTMEECATKLLEFGAKSVWGVVIAREG